MAAKVFYVRAAVLEDRVKEVHLGWIRQRGRFINLK